MSSRVEAARDAAHEDRWERRESREERPSLRAKSSGGASVIVVSESGRLLRASAASLPSVARSLGGGGGRLSSAQILKREPTYLDAKRRQRIRRTVHLKSRLPEVDAAQSKADSGARAAVGNVSASVSGAEATSPSDGSEASLALYNNVNVPSLASVLGRQAAPRHHKPRRHRHDSGASPKSRKYVPSKNSVRRPLLNASVADAHGRAVWRAPHMATTSLPDPVKPKMRSAGCCSGCCAKVRTAGSGSLLLLPLHLLVLVLLLSYLVLGAFIFSQLEARGSTEPEVLNVPNTVQLPGAPRDPAMMEARKELVERVINASLDIFLEKSQEAIIAAIFTSQRMQNALRAFELSRGVQLPTDDELGLLSRIVLAEWRRHLFNLTARYHAIITRNAHGLKTEEKERSEFWSSELPPPPLPWTFWTGLFHVFCLVSTIGGSIEAATMGGRTTTVMYSVLGVSLYVATVVVWAARCGAVLSVILRLFAKKKVESSSGKGRPSPYHSMNERRPSPAHHSLRGLGTLIFLLLVYVLSAGVHLVGGRDYWCGLENSILVLATIRPPTPIPQEKAEVLGFIAFVMVGHILLALLLAISKALCGRWWAAWSGTPS
nr:uncharacterized protein LOC113818129 [Penaeus vannamei]